MGAIRNNPDLAPITGDVIRVLVKFADTKASGANPLCRFDWMTNVFSGAGLFGDVQAFPAAFQTQVEPTLKACLAATALIIEYSAQAVSRNDVVSKNLAVTVSGTAGVNALPSNAAAVIQRNTTTKGQRGRGHVSLPYIPDTFTTPASATDVLNATARTAYAALISALWGTGTSPTNIVVAGHAYIPVICQTPPRGPNLVSKAAPILPSAVTLDLFIGTVRNRSRKRR